jgi:hypothetical protein
VRCPLDPLASPLCPTPAHDGEPVSQRRADQLLLSLDHLSAGAAEHLHVLVTPANARLALHPLPPDPDPRAP